MSSPKVTGSGRAPTRELFKRSSKILHREDKGQQRRYKGPWEEGAGAVYISNQRERHQRETGNVNHGRHWRVENNYVNMLPSGTSDTLLLPTDSVGWSHPLGTR